MPLFGSIKRDQLILACAALDSTGRSQAANTDSWFAQRHAFAFPIPTRGTSAGISSPASSVKPASTVTSGSGSER